MNIKVRADGGAITGLGHWSRCLSLVSCSSSDSIALYTQNPTEFKESFPTSGIDVHEITSEDDFVDRVFPGDIVILDVYNYPKWSVERISAAKALIVHVDDFDSAPCADIIINQSPGISPQRYKDAPRYATFLLGNQYSLVASDFKESATVDNLNRIDHLLIAMGGADPFNHTCRMLDQAEKNGTFKSVQVIVGSQFKHQEELDKRVARNTRLVAHKGLSKSEVAHQMKNCGVAILSASTMAQEYAHCRGLLGIEQTADNQKNLFEGLLALGVAVRAESLLRADRNELEKLFKNQVDRQRVAFDGLSGERFSRMFLELDLQSKVKMRRATVSDTEKTFQWASDNTIRAFSFSQTPITREGHTKWFEQKIDDGNCFYLIAELDDKPVGSIRFDRVGNELVVSYLIDSSLHGRGLGRILLAEGMKQLNGEWPTVNRVIGYVIATNTPSVRIFARLGFQQEDGSDKFPGSIRFYKTL